MGTKEKDVKSLQDKLKVFFKKGAGGGGSREELQLGAELARELSPAAAAIRRARALRDLTDVLGHHSNISEASMQKVWLWCRSALDASEGEVRGAALRLAGALAPRAAPLLRAAVFRWLREPPMSTAATAAAAGAADDDESARLAILCQLTDNGKNVACFEEEIGSFLVEWIREVDDQTTGGGAGNGALQAELLQLLTNVVKYNAAYLDEPVVHTIVETACGVCRWSGRGECVEGALALCEAVAAYSLVPRGALAALVRALCACLAAPGAAPAAWRVLRALLGGAAGAQALAALGAAAGDAARPHAARAAVYALGAALWRGRRAPSAAHVPLALAALLAAARLRLPAVSLEVVAAAHGLLARAPHLLRDLYWEQLLAALHEAAECARDAAVERELQAVLTTLERLQDAGGFLGSAEQLAGLLERVARPEASALRVVAWRAAALHVQGGAEWAARAAALADRYVRGDARRAVRLAALAALLAAADRARPLLHDDALEALLPILWSAATDADAWVRAAAAAAAPPLAAAASSDAVADLVDLLEKILNRPFELFVAEVAVPAPAAELEAAAAALGAVAAARLLRAPGAHAARALLVLVDHLHLHYKRPTLFMHHPHIRLKILELLFALRANEFNCVGLVCEEDGSPATGAGALRLKATYSPFLMVEPYAARGAGAGLGAAAAGLGAATAGAAGVAPPAALLPAARLARVLHTALLKEQEWAVLGAVLRALPALLAARALVLGRRAHELDALAGTLCALLAGGAGAGAGRGRAELHAALLAALVALAPLHAALEPATTQRLVRCLLKYGMVARAPQPALLALTLLTLETRDAMARMLPEVLLDLSKVSDTHAHAAPMLEFLSTLTRLPRVFASFVEDQYMSVFAIVLPYTNPSRYNHYVVSLAHHVIAAWFLKCRLSYRRNFVRFIIHGLHNYIIVPFEEQLQAQAPANEDSSTRQRSSSLGSRAPRGAGMGAGGARGAGAGAAGASAAFHLELTETCVELLARYTHTPVSVKPARSDVAGWLFPGGPSCTWLVGHRLITITTAQHSAHAHRPHAYPAPAPAPASAPVPAPAPDDSLLTDSIPSPQPPLSPPPHLINQNSEQDSSRSSSVSSGSQLQPPAPSPAPTPAGSEVKRGRGLWARGSSDTSSSSLSEQGPAPAAAPAPAPAPAAPAPAPAPAAPAPAPASLAAPAPPAHRSPLPSRQNSSESRADALLEALMQYSQRFEKTSKEIDTEEVGWSRTTEGAGGATGATGATVAGGAGGVGGAGACWCGAWAQVTVRAPTGDVSWLQRLQMPATAEDALREVAALLPPAPSVPAPAPADPAPADPATAGEPRPRSDSGGAASYARHTLDYKSRAGTMPINIPGSPQRPHAHSDDQLLLMMPEGKSRQPVKRSNSSPEMSSWKSSPPSPPPPGPPPRDKKNKKPERVSCEAIPEEMSGTSPANSNSHAAQVHREGSASTIDQEDSLSPTPTAAPAVTHVTSAVTSVTSTMSSTVTSAVTSAAPHFSTQPKHHHHLQKTASDSRVPPSGGGAGAGTGGRTDELPPLARSKRSNTISVCSPTRRPQKESLQSSVPRVGAGPGAGGGAGAGAAGGVTPAFVLLQLYHNMSTAPISPSLPGEQYRAEWSRPLRLSGVQHERSIKNLDLLPPLDTFKIGVLYVGPGQQNDEVAILRNEYGSVRYCEFVSGLGAAIPLTGAEPPPHLFLNVERGGKDGHYVHVWHDDFLQVLFHVATVMPLLPADPNCNEKRKYIGNDVVSIVYNDSGAEFSIHTIKGQLNLCIVVVEPLPAGANRITLVTKDERIRGAFLPHVVQTCVCVSDGAAAAAARQLGLHAALAAAVAQSLALGGAPFASNCLERLRVIKRLRRRAEAEHAAAAPPPPYARAASTPPILDFNDYT